MNQILRDSHGHKIGEIQESCGKKILRDEHGHKLGEYDGRVTRRWTWPFSWNRWPSY